MASAAAQTFTLSQLRSGVNVAVVFYDTAAAAAGDEIAAGTGARDVTVTGLCSGFAADGYAPSSVALLYDGGTVSGLVGGTLQGFSFGAQQVRSFTVAASGGSNPGGAVSYRIWVYA